MLIGLCLRTVLFYRGILVKLSKLFATAVGILFSAGSAATIANAATLTSVDRATFASAVLGGSISSDNYDTTAVGSAPTTAGVTYTASLGSAIVTNSFLTSTNPNGLGSTSVGFFQATETITFDFSVAITAFAIDINTFATSDGAYTATLNTGDTIDSIFETFSGQATGQFLGFVSDTAFTSLTLTGVNGVTDPNETYTLDTLIYGDAKAVTNVVPLPASLPLLLAGFGLFFGLRRRSTA